MRQRILVTGAAGKVGTMLRPRLARPDRVLRLLDVREPPPLDDAGAEETVVGSVDDLHAMTAACRDVAAVVHLGGLSGESSLDEVLRVNVAGTHRVLEATRRAGVGRVVYASSNHAVGFHARAEAGPDGLAGDAEPRPDTMYGWSKVAAEAACRLYCDRYGMDVVCLRIGSWSPRPREVRALATWLSPDDGARLVEASLSAPSPGFRTVWGVSRNTRRWWSLAAGEEIGFRPQDDAEAFAAELIARDGEPDWDKDPNLTRVGGLWCDTPLGGSESP
ncbi:MAG: NAD-dependent epimerase/dehydratase family protein [Stackebrandtia sp.]